MRWSPGKRSPNLEDRRGAGPLGIGLGGRGLGLGGLVLLFILSLVFGQDFFSLLGSGGGPTYATTEGARVEDPAEEPLVQLDRKSVV